MNFETGSLEVKKTRSPNQRKILLTNTPEVTFEVIVMNIVQNVSLDDPRSSLKLGYFGSKLGHAARSNKNLVNMLEVTFLKQSSRIKLKMFSW